MKNNSKNTFKWHKQSEEDIYDLFPNSWSLYRYACIMDDGTLQEFRGMQDESYDGEITLHIHAINDDYDDTDRIVMWIEIPDKV